MAGFGTSLIGIGRVANGERLDGFGAVLISDFSL